MNRDHLAAGPVIALASLRATLLVRLGDRLAAWPTPPVYAAVFGSVARGASSSDSDIDLFLVRPTDVDLAAWEDDTASLQADTARWTGNDLRVLDVDETGLAEPSLKAVLADIRRDALTVAGTRSWFEQTLVTAS